MNNKSYKVVNDGTVAKRLSIALATKGMGIVDLHELSGVAVCGISNYLNNKALPTRRTLTRIAKSLGVSIAWLSGITGTDDVVITEVEEEQDFPDALLGIYKTLSDNSKNYLLETAILLQVKDRVRRGNGKVTVEENDEEKGNH